MKNRQYLYHPFIIDALKIIDHSEKSLIVKFSKDIVDKINQKYFRRISLVINILNALCFTNFLKVVIKQTEFFC